MFIDLTIVEILIKFVKVRSIKLSEIDHFGDFSIFQRP